MFRWIGVIYAKYLLLKKPYIFKNNKGKEFLHKYAESEIKLFFFRLLVFINGFKLVDNYHDKKKKSDTVFILGSGDSINELSKKNWDSIKRHNIIGLNYSFVHPLIPDYHFMEMIPLKEMQDFFCEETQRKYADVDMFFQYKHIIKSKFNLKRYKFKQRAYVHVPHLYPTVHQDILELYFRDCKTRFGVSLSNLIHHNSHIGCAVMFAQALGYKNIVMLGIDLNGGDYFTDSEIESEVFPHIESYDKMNELRKVHFKIVNEYQNSKHPTVDSNLMKDRGAISMDDYFKVYHKVFIKNSETKLYVGNKKSILSKYLPVYPF